MELPVELGSGTWKGVGDLGTLSVWLSSLKPSFSEPLVNEFSRDEDCGESVSNDWLPCAVSACSMCIVLVSAQQESVWPSHSSVISSSGGCRIGDWIGSDIRGGSKGELRGKQASPIFDIAAKTLVGLPFLG